MQSHMLSSRLQPHTLDGIASEGCKSLRQLQKQIIPIESVNWNPCYEPEVLHKKWCSHRRMLSVHASCEFQMSPKARRPKSSNRSLKISFTLQNYGAWRNEFNVVLNNFLLKLSRINLQSEFWSKARLIGPPHDVASCLSNSSKK